MADPTIKTRRDRARSWFDGFVHRLLTSSNHLRLPTPTVLPITGALVGLYAGLAAGLFANLIGLVGAVALSPAARSSAPAEGLLTGLWETLTEVSWHPEYAIVSAPLALLALLLARLIDPGGPRDEVKRRLRILAFLLFGALALYYPLVALSGLNRHFGHDHVELLAQAPLWIVVVSPALGGLLVGWMLRNRPETHGHGLPSVMRAVRLGREGLPAEGGLLKLLASAVTIGSGGSAGREGPIVYGGAAFASAVGRTLGFTRKELSILLASGAAAGIAASFNAPIAGAVFAMEIILREFELKVFSPIILASVTATMVSRGVMGSAPQLERVGYQMLSGWEILAYVALGLLCGVLAFAFIRLLHNAESFFQGRFPGRLSTWLGKRPLAIRAMLGGGLAGMMALINPSVWGSGHDFINLATVQKLGFVFLLAACVLKLVATAVTLGSGGSGGTFFPAAVMGAMAGGAFGELVHALFPDGTASSGAYAMVGMGGGIAALTRGPLTGMMMLYELSGNYAIILPLMVTCTIASALGHYLTQRRGAPAVDEAGLLAGTPVRRLMGRTDPVKGSSPARSVVEQLLASDQGVLPVEDDSGRISGIVQLSQFPDAWRDEALEAGLRAEDVVLMIPLVDADASLLSALDLMDREDVDALPVIDKSGEETSVGLVTRASIRRHLFAERSRRHRQGTHRVAATEMTS